MNIKFEVKMTKKAMFDFMLYTSYTSLSGIVGVIFGGVTLVLGIRQCMFGSYSTAATFFLFAGCNYICNKGKSTDFSKRIPGRTVCGSSADDFYTYASQESQYQTRQCKLGGRPEDDN